MPEYKARAWPEKNRKCLKIKGRFPIDPGLGFHFWNQEVPRRFQFWNSSAIVWASYAWKRLVCFGHPVCLRPSEKGWNPCRAIPSEKRVEPIWELVGDRLGLVRLEAAGVLWPSRVPSPLGERVEPMSGHSLGEKGGTYLGRKGWNLFGEPKEAVEAQENGLA
jgi:hypothetical protein